MDIDEIDATFDSEIAEAVRLVGTAGTVDAGELLAAEGTIAEHLVLVVTGSLEVTRGGATVGRCEPGTFIGEGALVGEPARATVTAQSGGSIVTVDARGFRRLTAERPDLACRLLEWVLAETARRLRASAPPQDADDVTIDEPRSAARLDHVLGPGDWETVFSERRFDAGDIVSVEQHADGGDLLVVLDGVVGVDRATARGSRYVANRRAGDLVGVIAFGDGGARLGSIVAETPTVVAVLDRATYRALRDDRPDEAVTILTVVLRQMVRDAAAAAAVADLDRRVAVPVSDALADLPVERPDVLVVGGGPIGLIFAGWLRRWRPDTHVLVVERRSSPGHKVGESTLAATVRALFAMGLEQPILRRFFANKAGLRFFHCDTTDERPLRQLDVVDIEETYQVERRPLEILMQENARRQGVDLRTSTRVRLDDSDIDGRRFVIEDAAGELRCIEPKVVVDASGPAAVLARQLGVYRKDPEACGPLTYNSYFGYFTAARDVPLEHWGYPATRHLCFPGGWMWFITVTSWEGTPDEAIAGMASDLLDARDGGAGDVDGNYPSRDELIGRHGGEHHQRLSIGITVRDDQDLHDVPATQRFDALVDRYPALRWVMDHFELIEEPYEEKRRPFQAFSKMVHDVERFAGDGWLVVGDAAAFTSPLFSPGLNYGVGHAYMAARAVADALDDGDVGEAAFAEYEHHMRAVFDTFIRETEMYYRAFDHADSYERAIASKIVYGAHDVVDEREFGPGDTRVHAILDHEWQSYVDRHTALQRRLEAEGVPAADRAAATRPLVDRFIRRVVERPSNDAVDLGRFVDFWEPDGTYVEHRERGTGLFSAVVCPSCSLTTDASLPRCPYCESVLV